MVYLILNSVAILVGGGAWRAVSPVPVRQGIICGMAVLHVLHEEGVKQGYCYALRMTTDLHRMAVDDLARYLLDGESDCVVLMETAFT